MELKKLSCRCCGSDEIIIENMYCKCAHCNSTYLVDKAKEYAEELRSVLGDAFDEQKLECIANARKNLWVATHADHISSEAVITYAQELKKLIPDDFQANFYELAVSGTNKQINAFLNDIDTETHGFYISSIVDFLLMQLESSNVLPLKELITRGLRGNEYTEYITKVEDEAQKVKSGLYNPQVPRDVFVAYSSKDYRIVSETVEFLEDNKINCFVAQRNMRHGKGSVESYNDTLKIAMHNCKCVVFLSSDNSRDLECDALKIELPYIKDNEPNMGRIEYLLTEYGKETSLAAKLILESFFGGLEYCRTKEDLVKRILGYITGNMGDTTAKKQSTHIVQEVKYCINCGTENPITANFCSNCSSGNFVDTYDEFDEKIKKQKAEESKRIAIAQKREARAAAKETRKVAKAEEKANTEEERTGKKLKILYTIFAISMIIGLFDFIFTYCAPIKTDRQYFIAWLVTLCVFGAFLIFDIVILLNVKNSLSKSPIVYIIVWLSILVGILGIACLFGWIISNEGRLNSNYVPFTDESAWAWTWIYITLAGVGAIIFIARGIWYPYRNSTDIHEYFCHYETRHVATRAVIMLYIIGALSCSGVYIACL